MFNFVFIELISVRSCNFVSLSVYRFVTMFPVVSVLDSVSLTPIGGGGAARTLQ